MSWFPNAIRPNLYFKLCPAIWGVETLNSLAIVFFHIQDFVKCRSVSLLPFQLSFLPSHIFSSKEKDQRSKGVNLPDVSQHFFHKRDQLISEYTGFNQLIFFKAFWTSFDIVLSWSFSNSCKGSFALGHFVLPSAATNICLDSPLLSSWTIFTTSSM